MDDSLKQELETSREMQDRKPLNISKANAEDKHLLKVVHPGLNKF